MAFNTYPQNPYPSNSEMLQKLDAVAKAIDGMPTFTSNDKAFLEELPAFPNVDGKKVLTATTESGETVLSWEDKESGVVDYSTTEQATGQKWIDGKDIYCKTVEINNPVSTGTPTSVNHGADVDKIVKIDGHAENSGVFIPATYYASSSYYAMVYASDSSIIYDMKWNNTPFTTLLVTIYYTKATV